MLNKNDLKKIQELFASEFKNAGEALEKNLDEKLEKRFATFEKKMDEKLDARFSVLEKRMDEKLDARFSAFEKKMDAKLDRKLDARFIEFKKEINEDIDARFVEFRKEINKDLDERFKRFREEMDDRIARTVSEVVKDAFEDQMVKIAKLLCKTVRREEFTRLEEKVFDLSSDVGDLKDMYITMSKDMEYLTVVVEQQISDNRNDILLNSDRIDELELVVGSNNL